jgi:hypothetical protein
MPRLLQVKGNFTFVVSRLHFARIGGALAKPDRAGHIFRIGVAPV